MSKRMRVFLLVTTVLVVALGVPALAQAKAAPTVTKPKFSAPPVAGVPFTASGVVRPKATSMSRTVVKVGLYAFADGRWVVQGLSRAKLVAGASGTQYSRRLTVAAEGKYGVRAFHYRAGKLVAKSALAAFDVARRITIDSNVNGWMAPELGETQAPAGTPLDVVFTTPADWAAPLVDGKPLNGAAHFIWGEFEKVDARRADLAHRRPAAGSLRLDARRDAQVRHRLPGRRPADRHRQGLAHARTRTRCRTCRRTSRSARSAPPAWAATAASRSSPASSRRRAPTRSSGTPTAWSPAATTGSAGWTTATSASSWSTTPPTWPSTRIRTTW